MSPDLIVRIVLGLLLAITVYAMNVPMYPEKKKGKLEDAQRQIKVESLVKSSEPEGL